MLKPLPLVVLALAAGAVQAAGTVQVSFVKPENFADVKDRAMTRDAKLSALKEQLEAAASPYVADGQTMKIDVLDVDLAGEPSHRFDFNDVRVLRGRADWPVIKMRWSLETPGQAARGGEATLSDMAYLERIHSAYANGPLAFERRMLDDWFRNNFKPN